VNGSYYVQLERLDWLPFALSIPVGFLATAILVVNNIRDIDTDRRVGKKTLAVRLGRQGTRRRYVGVGLGAYAPLPVRLLAGGSELWPLVAFVTLPLAPFGVVTSRTDGPSLNGALAGTGRLLALFSLLVSAGLLVS